MREGEGNRDMDRDSEREREGFGEREREREKEGIDCNLSIQFSGVDAKELLWREETPRQ